MTSLSLEGLITLFISASQGTTWIAISYKGRTLWSCLHVESQKRRKSAAQVSNDLKRNLKENESHSVKPVCKICPSSSLSSFPCQKLDQQTVTFHFSLRWVASRWILNTIKRAVLLCSVSSEFGNSCTNLDSHFLKNVSAETPSNNV